MAEKPEVAKMRGKLAMVGRGCTNSCKKIISMMCICVWCLLGVLQRNEL